MFSEIRYGPWAPTCAGTERIAQLRALAAITHLQLGHNHPLVSELRAAEASPDALGRAWAQVERLPAPAAHLLGSFSAFTWPPRKRRSE
jgi:hypothetical protein